MFGTGIPDSIKERGMEDLNKLRDYINQYPLSKKVDQEEDFAQDILELILKLIDHIEWLGTNKLG